MTLRDSLKLKSFSFAIFMIIAVVSSILPAYFSALGYTNIQVGILYSLGPAIGIISNLVWGYISDRFRVVKLILLILLSAQFIMLLLLFQFDWFPIVFVIMIGFYFFQTPLNSMNDTQILLTVSKTGQSYASFRIWGSLGFAFSALSFGILLEKFGLDILPYLCLAALLISILLALGLRETRGQMGRIQLSGIYQILFSRKLLQFLGLVLLISVAHRSNDGFLVLYMLEMGASSQQIGFAWMFSSLSEIPIFFLLAKYGHRFKELPLLAIAAIFYSLRFLLTGSVENPFWILIIQTMHSVTFGIFLVTSLRYILQLVPDSLRATGQALFHITWSSMAGLLSGLIGGWLFDTWGGKAVYQFASVTALVACIGFLLTYWLGRDNRG